MCALAEFAMVIIVHQTSDLKAADTTTTEEKENEIKGNRSEVPLKNKLQPASTALGVDTSIMRKILMIPLNGGIDFIAILIHFFLFVLFNSAYWITYWNN